MVSPKKKKSKPIKRNDVEKTLQPSLLDAAGPRQLPTVFAAVSQIKNLIPAFDDQKLRRLCDSTKATSTNPSTGQTWIPKPIRARYDLVATLAGIIAWLEHQIAQRDGLPENYASKSDFCARTRFPERMLDYAIANGCTCKDDHGRIRLTPFIEYWQPHLAKVVPLLVRYLNGEIVAGTDLQNLDLTEEQAGLTRVKKLSEEVDYQLKVRRVHDENYVLARVQEIVGPVREAYQVAVKKWHRLKPTVPDIDRQIFEHDLPHFLKRHSFGQPALGLAEIKIQNDQPTDYEI